METLPGTWREPHRDTAFPRDEAFRVWAEAAVPVLEKVASRYGGYITYKGFAQELFDATGVHTGQQLNYWVGDVLASVISACSERGLPELSSLVVHAGDGMVGSGFNAVLLRSGRKRIEDPYELEMAAAEERLNCYRAYCLDLPDERKPQLTKEYAARVRRKEPAAPRARPVCTVHGIQLPTTGICDYCG